MPTQPKTYTRTETYYNQRYVTPDNPTGKFTRTYTGDSAYSINESTQITQTSPQPQGTYSGNVFIPDSAVQPQEPTPEVKQPVVQDLFKQMEAENKKQQSPSQVPNIERVDLTTPRQAPPRMISRQETQPSQQQYVEQFLPTKDEVRGEVRAVEKPKSNLEALRKYAREGEDMAQQRGYGGSVQTNPVTLIGASAVVGGVDVIIHPVQTAKGIAQSVINPVGTLKETGKQLETSPANLIGTVAGQTAVLGVVGKSNPLKLEIGETSIKQVGSENIVVKNVGVVNKYTGKAVNIVSKTPDGVDVGSANILPYLEKAPSGEILRIGKATETRMLQKNIKKLTPKQAVNEARLKEYIPTAQKILSETQNVKNKYQTDFLKNTERLGEKGTAIVLEVTKKNKGVLSGSFSRGADLMTEGYKIYGEDYVLNKKPRDIDIHLDKSPIEIELIAKDTLKQLREAGYDARLVDEGGIVKNAIEVKQPKGGYEKAVEFLGEGTIPLEEVPPDYVLGIKKTGKPEIIKASKNKLLSEEIIDFFKFKSDEGIKKTTLSEELRGVTQGTARLQKTPEGLFDIYPPEKRVKDIGSVTVSSRTLASSKLRSGKLLKNIEKFESFYPKEEVLSQLNKVGEDKIVDKKILADYSPSKFTEYGKPSEVNKVIVIKKEKENIMSEFNKNKQSRSEFSLSSKPKSEVSKLPKISVSSSGSPSSKSFKPSPSISPSPSPSKPSPSVSVSPSPSKPSPSISPSPSPSKKFPSPYPPKIKSFSLSKKSKESKFSVLVRRRGKFEKRGEAKTKEEAIRRGKFITSNTATASFKILNKGETVDVGNIGDKYTVSKKEKGVLIQKNKFRISTVGEKAEIPYSANKNKKIFGGKLI